MTPSSVRFARLLSLCCLTLCPIPAFAQLNTAPSVACTDEAKICPDGTGVGRTGPNCEFTPCPGEATPPNPATPICNMGPMRCPDGSMVSPGPQCQFAPCPGSSPGSGGSEGSPGSSGSGAGGMRGSGEPGPGASSGSSGSQLVRASVVNMNDVGLSSYPDLPLEELPSEPQSVEFIVQHRTSLNGKRVTIHGVIISAILGEAACPSTTTHPAMGRPCMQPRIVLANGTEGRDTNYDTVVLLQPSDKTAYEAGQTADVKGTVNGSTSSLSIRKDYDNN